VTQENKEVNIALELEKAESSLKSAEVLAAHGQYADAVSRLYYYLFHSVRALLFSKGFEPKTHEGTLRLLGMHFIKPGILPTNISHIVTRLMKYREEADYNPSYVFTEEDYADFRKEADAANTAVKEFLTREHFL
jgi:uncharacterized protein (UPF0332 family)